jgi:signal transduction histidine kinase
LTADDALRDRLLAERDERRRLAELLHDGPVQHLAALGQMLGAAEHALDTGDPDVARTIVARAGAVTREAAGELREIVGGLEPPILAEHGLGPALRELCGRTVARRGAQVTLELDDPPPLGPGASSGLYQIAREALDQAVRRGPPGVVRVALRQAPDGGVELIVEDDAAPERRQAVIDGLAERASELNATIAAERRRGRTVLRVRMPPSATAL